MTYLLLGIILLYGGYLINWLRTKGNNAQKGEEYDRQKESNQGVKRST